MLETNERASIIGDHGGGLQLAKTRLYAQFALRCKIEPGANLHLLCMSIKCVHHVIVFDL